MKPFLLSLSLCLFSFALPASSKWGDAYKWGELDTDLLDEESGMVPSREYSNRLYHHNDSGDGPFFYITDLKGRGVREVTVKNWEATDVEDIAIGSYTGKNCIYLADIGDNDDNRQIVKIAIIEEKETFSDSISPLKVLSLRYPEGAHNAESLFLDPQGNLYIVTKTKKKPAEIYRLSRQQIESDEEDLRLSLWGEIDVTKLTKGEDARVTSAVLSREGKRLILLTYQDAFELTVDLQSKVTVLNAERVKLHALPKQESIAFLPDESALLYGMESDDEGTAEIWRVNLK